jgi:hypothetical protein
MVDHLGQLLAETREQFVLRQAGLRYQAVDLIGAQRTGKIARRCPSSDNLRLIRHFEKGGSGSSGVRV